MTALQVHAAHEAESCGFPQKTPLQDRPGGHPVHALPMLCTGAGRALTGRAAGAMGRTGRPPSVALGGDRNRGAPASCSQGSARRPGPRCSQLLSTSRAGRHPLTLRRLRALP